MAGTVIAAIGAGGKSTALWCLANQFASRRVLVTTTTHIRIPMHEKCRLLVDPDEPALMEALAGSGVVCAGSSGEAGKLGALPAELLQKAIKTADLVLYEADGARCLPLKLHESYEPVLLHDTYRCLIVAGLSALDRPIGETIHRWQLEPGWDPDQPVDGRILLDCVLETARAGGLHPLQYKVLLNQEDALDDRTRGESLARAIRRSGFDCRSGSLKEDHTFLSSWLVGKRFG